MAGKCWQERLDRILGFVLYGMAVRLDMKPPVQAAPTCLCCEIIIHSVSTLPQPLLSPSYSILCYCCSTDSTHQQASRSQDLQDREMAYDASENRVKTNAHERRPSGNSSNCSVYAIVRECATSMCRCNV